MSSQGDTVEAGQVRKTMGNGKLYIERSLGDGWWRVSWDPPAAPGTPPLTNRLQESKIFDYELDE